LENFSR
jgi:hypothetical protein